MRMMQIIAVLFALTVTQLGHAEPTDTSDKPNLVQATDVDPMGDFLSTLQDPYVDFDWTDRDMNCLARNIYYEAANEPEEGKVAVGMVTINRVKDPHYADSVCRVVHEHVVYRVVHTVMRTVLISTGWFGIEHKEKIPQKKVVKVAVCQFSWYCGHKHKIRADDERWIDSKAVAEKLLNNGYPQLRKKYATAMYYHNIHVRPRWSRHMHRIARVGGHIFYASANQ